MGQADGVGSKMVWGKYPGIVGDKWMRVRIEV